MRHSIKHVKGQLIKTGNFIQKVMKDKKNACKKKETTHSRSGFEDERRICNLQSPNLNRVWTQKPSVMVFSMD